MFVFTGAAASAEPGGGGPFSTEQDTVALPILPRVSSSDPRASEICCDFQFVKREKKKKKS